jgi:lysophospholipase L1-like esterase
VGMKYVTRLILFLLGIGMIPGGFEIFLRINPSLGAKYSFSEYDESKKKPTSNWLSGASAEYRPSPIVGYELVPHSTPEINSLGMIGQEYSVKKEPGIYRILILGDSIAAQGYGADFLGEELNKNPLLNKKYKFEIWNSGVFGYGIRQYDKYLKYKGVKYNPDLVIIFFCLNDFNINTCVYYKDRRRFRECDFHVREICKRYTPNSFLMRHSYLYRFVIMRLENYLVNKAIRNGRDPREEDADFYAHSIKDTCQANGIPLFGVVFCYLKPINEYTSVEAAEYQLMAKVLKDSKMRYIDLHDHLSDEQKIGMREFRKNEIDYLHPSEGGHKIIAGIIYDYLLENFINKN